jgi:hypothetical protein
VTKQFGCNTTFLLEQTKNEGNVYAWTMTKDFLADGSIITHSEVGVVGPRGAKLTVDEILNHPDRKKFRLRDDDGELYYEGYLVGGEGFEPLDDFGMPNAGATTIEFWEEGGWKPL